MRRLELEENEIDRIIDALECAAELDDETDENEAKRSRDIIKHICEQCQIAY